MIGRKMDRCLAIQKEKNEKAGGKKEEREGRIEREKAKGVAFILRGVTRIHFKYFIYLFTHHLVCPSTSFHPSPSQLHALFFFLLTTEF